MSEEDRLSRRLLLPEPNLEPLKRRAEALVFLTIFSVHEGKVYWQLYPINGTRPPERPYSSLHFIDDQLLSYEQEGVPSARR